MTMNTNETINTNMISLSVEEIYWLGINDSLPLEVEE